MSNKKGLSTISLALVAALGLGVLFVASQYVDSKTSAPSTAGLFSTLTGQTSTSTSIKGSGAPSGPHYNLNLIGVPKGKTADMTGSSGRRIFVPLVGKCSIKLSQGEFAVLDANCTDNNQASFQLPNPDPENDGVTEYSVWARALGKPGGSSTTNTCATDPATGLLWCSVYQMVMVRGTGKSTFTDVSRELLYIYADINGDGVQERYNLFSDALQDYFWSYDNNGLKLLQLRFYEIPSTVL